MEELIKIARAFVDAMSERRGIAHVDDLYAEDAESVEAVEPPDRDQRIAKGRGAIKAKREDWAATHEIHKLEADGPYVHPPNKFAVRFRADVTQISTGRKMILREVAVYSVEENKIIREEFFMVPN